MERHRRQRTSAHRHGGRSARPAIVTWHGVNARRRIGVGAAALVVRPAVRISGPWRPRGRWWGGLLIRVIDGATLTVPDTRRVHRSSRLRSHRAGHRQARHPDYLLAAAWSSVRAGTRARGDSPDHPCPAGFSKIASENVIYIIRSDRSASSALRTFLYRNIRKSLTTRCGETHTERHRRKLAVKLTPTLVRSSPQDSPVH